MKPLGPNQRRLLEALADGRQPVPGRMGWTYVKIKSTIASLEARGLVDKTEIVTDRSVIVRYHLTEEGMSVVRPRSLLGTGSITLEHPNAPFNEKKEGGDM